MDPEFWKNYFWESLHSKPISILNQRKSSFCDWRRKNGWICTIYSSTKWRCQCTFSPPQKNPRPLRGLGLKENWVWEDEKVYLMFKVSPSSLELIQTLHWSGDPPLYMQLPSKVHRYELRLGQLTPPRALPVPPVPYTHQLSPLWPNPKTWRLSDVCIDALAVFLLDTYNWS